MIECGPGMTDATTLNGSATQRYVGVADWWGVQVWVEESGSRRALPYRGEIPLAGFAWAALAWPRGSWRGRSSSTRPDHRRLPSATAGT